MVSESCRPRPASPMLKVREGRSTRGEPKHGASIGASACLACRPQLMDGEGGSSSRDAAASGAPLVLPVLMLLPHRGGGAESLTVCLRCVAGCSVGLEGAALGVGEG